MQISLSKPFFFFVFFLLSVGPFLCDWSAVRQSFSLSFQFGRHRRNKMEKIHLQRIMDFSLCLHHSFVIICRWEFSSRSGSFQCRWAVELKGGELTDWDSRHVKRQPNARTRWIKRVRRGFKLILNDSYPILFLSSFLSPQLVVLNLNWIVNVCSVWFY